eukprot:2695981-Heterocapsa_arctica.AAC.1
MSGFWTKQVVVTVAGALGRKGGKSLYSWGLEVRSLMSGFWAKQVAVIVVVVLVVVVVVAGNTITTQNIETNLLIPKPGHLRKHF